MMIVFKPISRAAYSLIECIIVLFIIALMTGILIPAVHKARKSLLNASCQANLGQIGLALHNYHSAFGSFPPGISFPDGINQKKSSDITIPVVPWHCRILDYIGESSLSQQFRTAYLEDYLVINSPPHSARSAIIKLYLCPNDLDKSMNAFGYAATSYLGSSGTKTAKMDGVLFSESYIRLSDISDGSAYSLLVGERPPHEQLGLWYGGWGRAQNGIATNLLGVNESNPGYYSMCSLTSIPFGMYAEDDPCKHYSFRSNHTVGANFVFADGSCRHISHSEYDIVKALSTRSGGEIPCFE